MKYLLAFAASLIVLIASSAPVQGSGTAVAPTVTLSFSLPQPYAGETATVRWSSVGASWCSASGAWSGSKPLQGEQQVGPLTTPGTFQLDCGNSVGTTARAVTYSIAGNRPVSGLGVFDIGCNFSHALPDDPIVFPGQPGASHMHDFFGFTGTNASSTIDSMRRSLERDPSETTCTEGIRRDDDPPAANASGYWVPSMYVNGQKVNAQHVHVYYRQELRQPVRAFAPGFRMLAGDKNATPQSAKADAVIRWWCGGMNNTTIDHLPPDCAGRQGIHSEIRFPACWDGRVDSPDHKSHLAYRRITGTCPETHPFRIPRILMHVDFQVRDQIGRDLRASDKITLASGGMWTMHADYLFAWDSFRLDQLVHSCLNARQNCKLTPPRGSISVLGRTVAPVSSRPADASSSEADTDEATSDESEPTEAPGEDDPPSTEEPPSSEPTPTPPPATPPSTEPRLEILELSPSAPHAGAEFSVKFAVLKGDERQPMQNARCSAAVGSTFATLKRQTMEGRTGTCVWALPATPGETLLANIFVEADGRPFLTTIQQTVR